MSKKIKYSKLAVVLFLTILIWVWADLALDETRSISTATIVIGKTKPNLWVSFPKGSSVDVNSIVLKGPGSNINKINQIISDDPGKLEFPLLIEQFDIDKAGQYPIDVREIIQQSSWIKKSGVSIETCDPCEVLINVVALSEREIDVRCFNEEELPIELETPKKVRMYVPSDWRDTARVVLSFEEIQNAVKQPITKKPYIILSADQVKFADDSVEIKLPPQDKIPVPRQVNNAKLQYSFSENLLKEPYSIVVDNLPEILNIAILAMPAAKEAYENQSFQVLLEIFDSDIEETKKNEWVNREVYYKFPEEFVRANQIELAQKKVTAKFKVIPLTKPETP